MKVHILSCHLSSLIVLLLRYEGWMRHERRKARDMQRALCTRIKVAPDALYAQNLGILLFSLSIENDRNAIEECGAVF